MRLSEEYDTNDFIIKNRVLVKYTGNSKDVVIPGDVTEIGVVF